MILRRRDTPNYTRNNKALSQTISSIILIAVVVAVAIVTASWMGGVSIGLMQNVEQATITNTAFTTNPVDSVIVTVQNHGSSSVTLQRVYIDEASATMTTVEPTDSLTIDKGTYANIKVTNTAAFKANTKYTIKFTTTKGNNLVVVAETTSTPQTISWLSGWDFRKSHTIDGSTSTAGTDYQIQIITQYGVGADDVNTVYLNNKAKADFSDIRFVDADQVTQLSYWLEQKTDGQTATFWVKIPKNLTSQIQTIYIYYGNSLASTNSNGEATFIFFDDFSGDLSKWTKEINTNHIYIDSGYLVLDGGKTSSPYGHTSIGSSATYTNFQDGIIEANVYPSTNALPEIGFRGTYNSNTGYKVRWDCRSGSESPWMKPPYTGWSAFGSSITRAGLSNQWQKVRVDILENTFKMYSNNVLKSSVTNSQFQDLGEIMLQNHYGSSVFFDNVRVRKCVSVEPIQSNWGIETMAP